MKEPYETCNKGYEYYFNKRIKGEITEEEWNEWYKEHCKKCSYFSGYICAKGEVTLNTRL